MSRNGTDRDVAKMMLDAFTAIKTAVANINAHLFSVYIITQPADTETEAEGTATFSVVAANVTAYQWEYRKTGTTAWQDSAVASATTANLSVTIPAAAAYDREYRCKLTGKDGGIVYTDIADLTIVGG